MEVWKDIIGYEGLYQVSNLGRIKSLERIDTVGRLKNEIILKSAKTSTGYLGVGLCKNGKAKTKKIHQLVAIHFLNHKPCGYELVVNHKDLNKLNNDKNNLEIITQRENANHKHLESSSKYTGVSWDKRNKKWASKIFVKGKKKHLGYFKNEYDAYTEYKKELSEILKENTNE